MEAGARWAEDEQRTGAGRWSQGKPGRPATIWTPWKCAAGGTPATTRGARGQGVRAGHPRSLGILAISDVLAQFIAYLPQIIAAILILILATLLANFVAGIVRGATGSNIAGSVAQYGIIVFAAFAALTQLGIAKELIAPTFLILLGGVSLAAAIAFGLGGQGVAKQMVEQGYEKSGEAKQLVQQQKRQEQQGGRTSESYECSEDDGQKVEARRLRREY
jgi:hypothetical protein